MDRASLKGVKACITKDFLPTEKALQVDVVSFEAALATGKDACGSERELIAERLIRGLAHLVAEQEPCRIVLLGYGDAAWTLQLALSGGSMASNSMSEPVRDVWSSTVGVIVAPFSNSIDQSLQSISTKFESVLRKRLVQNNENDKALFKKLPNEAVGPDESTLDKFRSIKSDILESISTFFEGNEPLGDPTRTRSHPQNTTLTDLQLVRSASTPDGAATMWETRAEPAQDEDGNDTQAKQSSPISAVVKHAEGPVMDSQANSLQPTPRSSRSASMLWSKNKRVRSIMEEEVVAGVYFGKWDLPSAMRWYEKALDKLSQEPSDNRHNNIKISITNTFVRLGQFEKALKTLDGISVAQPSLHFESVLAQCRSLCCTSSQACRKAATDLETINKRYERVTAQSVLNSSCLASLKLFLGENRDAELIASKAASQWKEMREVQHHNLQSPGNKGQSQQEELEKQLEMTTKNILDNEFRLVKIRTERGQIEDAFESNADLLRQASTTWGSNHVVTLRVSNFHSRLLLLQENLSEAEATCKTSIRRVADRLGSEHYITLDFVGTLVKIYFAQGRRKEAKETVEDLVVRNRTAIGEYHPQTIESEMDLSSALDLLGKPVTAERFHRSVHEKCKAIFGPDHPTTVISGSQLASIHLNAGNIKEAMYQLEAVQATLKKICGLDHQSLSLMVAKRTIASLARKLANHYRAHANSRELENSMSRSIELFNESEHHLGEVMEFQRRVFGKDHAEYLSTLFEWHLVKRDKEEKVDHELLRNLHEILKRRSARSRLHPEITTMQHELSLSYASIGQWTDALRLENAALDARIQLLGETHPDVLKSRLQLAPIVWCIGEMEEAVTHLRRAHDTIHNCPRDFPAFDMLSITGNLANALVEIGKYDEAVELQERLVEQSKRRSNYLLTRNDLAFIYQKQNRLDEAEKEYDAIEEELNNRSSLTSQRVDPLRIIVQTNKASLNMQRKKYEEAERLQRVVKNILKNDEAYGELNRDTITSRYNLALILKQRREDDRARKQLGKAVKHMQELLGEDHVETKEMDAKLQEWESNRVKRRDSGVTASDKAP